MTGRILNDNDGHTYLIPLEMVAEFEDALERGDDDAINFVFDKYRLSHHLSCYVATLELQ